MNREYNNNSLRLSWNLFDDVLFYLLTSDNIIPSNKEPRILSAKIKDCL